MPASPVVDLHRWRAQSRGPRPAAQGTGTRDTGTQETGVQVAATPAAVLPLPPAGRRGRYPGQVGPTSPFGPVMAFGLRARPDAATGAATDDATDEATGTTGTAAGAAAGAATLALVPEEPEAPVVTSWARGARSRARAGARPGARTDARGAARGPRR